MLMGRDDLLLVNRPWRLEWSLKISHLKDKMHIIVVN